MSGAHHPISYRNAMDNDKSKIRDSDKSVIPIHRFLFRDWWENSYFAMYTGMIVIFTLLVCLFIWLVVS